MPITSRFAAAAARAYGMFSNLARAVDPFFNYVTALLHGDGTNGAQNNTFLDSSTNNFTITRNGNTTQGTFSPFSQTGWGNYVSANNYLSIADNAAFQFGSGDYTIECWINLSAITAGGGIFGYGPVGGLTNSWTLEYNSGTSALSFWMYNANPGTYIINGTTNPVSNQWIHVAVSRSGNNTRLFINGNQEGSTYTSTYTSGTGNSLYIGAGFYAPSTRTVTGYISNLRIVKGTGLYTANFTPSTTPLTAVSGTTLLTCQANRFLDASSSALTITLGGTPSVQAFSPFNPTTAWSASSNGGSGYWDGAGDYLQPTANAAFAFGTGNFTVECWIYATDANDDGIYEGRSDGVTADGFTLTAFSSSVIRMYTSSALITASGLSYLYQWTHVALVCNAGTTTLYINGVSKGSTTTVTNCTYTGPVIGIGRYSASNTPTAANSFNGYIADFRVVKGTAVYTANFTPPTAPLTAITNTSLLLSATNAGIYDNAAVGDYETVGNAQVSTSVKKYGTGSMSFDGTGDAVQTASTPNNAFGTGDFTIEFWAYFNTVSAVQALFDWRPVSTNGAYPHLYLNSDGTLRYYVSSADRITSGALSASTWYHIVVCRVASQTKLFVNGTQVGSTYADTTTYLQSSISLGATMSGASSLNGYIDDWRVTKGIGRYPYNFTAPTAAFPNIGGTVTLTADPYYNYTTLLLPGNGTNGAQNNTFLDSSSNAFTITRNGNTTQGNFSPFSQTGWGNYFDGNGDYLITTSTQVIPTGSFTVETFVYPTSSSDSYAVAQGTTGNAGRFSLGITSSLWYVQIGTAQVNAGSVALNQWTHLAATFNGTTLTLYVNGTSVGTAATTTNVQNTTLRIGSLGPADWGTFYWTGYISNTRSTNSVVYTSNFTPPTSALTAISGTTFLSCQSNRFIDNSTNAYAITRNGDTSVQAFSPFAPTAAWSASTNGGSGYFDGSGDYLVLPSSSNLAFGTGDFSVEGWVYLTSLGSNANIYSNATANDTEFAFTYLTTGVIRFSGWNTVFVASGSGAVTTNQWLHVVACRSGTTGSIFVNGSRVATATVTNNFSGTTAFGVGASGAGASPITGYIGSFRVLKGSSAYDATQTTLTVPTAPLTAITNTQLLLSATNGAIVDVTAKNDLETVGNAQISTTQSKFGGSSMYFDGTGDYLVSTTKNLLSFGSGDFTIEGWVYVVAHTNADGCICLNWTGTWSANNWSLHSDHGSANEKFTFWVYNYSSSAPILTSTTTVATNTWYHVAVTRFGNTWKLFVNGTQEATQTSSVSVDAGASYPIYVSGALPAQVLNGYIDDLRITRGIARYTSNFTPPTSAFLLQ